MIDLIYNFMLAGVILFFVFHAYLFFALTSKKHLETEIKRWRSDNTKKRKI